MLGIKTNELENLILATFLYSSECQIQNNMKDIFTLDAKYFSTKLKKRIVELLNSCEPYEYGFNAVQIEEKCIGTTYEIEMLEIMANIPYSFYTAKRYYELLKERKGTMLLCS